MINKYMNPTIDPTKVLMANNIFPKVSRKKSKATIVVIAIKIPLKEEYANSLLIFNKEARIEDNPQKYKLGRIM